MGFWLGLVERNRMINIAIKYWRRGRIGGSVPGRSSPEGVRTNLRAHITGFRISELTVELFPLSLCWRSSTGAEAS